MKLTFGFYLNIVIFVFVLMMSFVIGLFVFDYSRINDAAATEEEKDIIPPQLSNIEIINTDATSTMISWKTDELSDSLINYGLNKNYGILREPRFDKMEHSLILEDLLPDSDYYFRVTSADLQGNQGISSDYSFRTDKIETEDKNGYAEEVIDNGDGGLTEDLMEEGKAGTDKVDIEQTLSVEQVVQFIEQITKQEEGTSMPSSEEVLEQIQEEIQNKAEEIIAPPTIILDYADVEVGTDYAIITWATDKDSNSIVALADEIDYDENQENPYIWKEGEGDELVLSGLSSDKTFKTKSIKPEIYNLQIYKIEEESATIRWSTNVPCSSVIEYTNLNNGEAKLEGSSAYLTVHSMKLTNLVFDTYYSAVIKVESEDGEISKSDPVAFITIRDEYAPIISKVNTESTLYPGSDNKIQTIASWQTDEVATCQLFYHQGLISVDEAETLPAEEDEKTKHVEVITNFAPSTVYKFWIICADEAGNEAKSEDFTMLTPTQEESIIDIILKNFESSFGWVKKMKM